MSYEFMFSVNVLSLILCRHNFNRNRIQNTYIQAIIKDFVYSTSGLQCMLACDKNLLQVYSDDIYLLRTKTLLSLQTVYCYACVSVVHLREIVGKRSPRQFYSIVKLFEVSNMKQ
jgi:hypothetical protein